MQTNDFTDTVGKVAREAEVSPPTVALYAKLGLIEARKASNGFNLFRQGTGAKVRQIHAERLANRGGKRRA